jgi:hypothetical protein
MKELVMELSKSQIDRFGDRLRKSGLSPTEAELEILRELRDAHEGALRTSREILEGMGLTPTSRSKTPGSIVLKLRREEVA